MTDLVLTGGTPVRANWGRWISRCPTCPNAWLVDPSVILWMCRECWTVTRPTWPPDPMAIEWLLMQRPDVITRNWEGESLTELLFENVENGIIPPDLVAIDGAEDVMTTEGGRVVSGVLLPSIERYRELVGAPGARMALEGN